MKPHKLASRIPSIQKITGELARTVSCLFSSIYLRFEMLISQVIALFLSVRANGHATNEKIVL
jgi:hypothetical protein